MPLEWMPVEWMKAMPRRRTSTSRRHGLAVLSMAVLSRSVAAIGCVLLSACMTTGAGNELKAGLEKQISDLAAENKTRDEALQAKLDELAAGLERARSLLTR